MTHKLYIFFADAHLETLSPNVSIPTWCLVGNLATFWSKSVSWFPYWKDTRHTTQNLSFFATPTPQPFGNLSPTWCCLIQIRSRTIQWRNAMFLEGTFDTFPSARPASASPRTTRCALRFSERWTSEHVWNVTVFKHAGTSKIWDIFSSSVSSTKPDKKKGFIQKSEISPTFPQKNIKASPTWWISWLVIFLSFESFLLGTSKNFPLTKGCPVGI